MAFRIFQPRAPVQYLARWHYEAVLTLHNVPNKDRLRLFNPRFEMYDGNISVVHDNGKSHIVTLGTLLTVKSHTFWLKPLDNDDYHIFPTPKEAINYLNYPVYYHGKKVIDMHDYGFITDDKYVSWNNMDYETYRMQSCIGPIRFAINAVATATATEDVASDQYNHQAVF